MIFTMFRFSLAEMYSTDPETISYCAERIMKVEIVQFLINSYEITAGALRGLGCSLTPALITIFGSCCLRLLWIATVFSRFHTYESILFVYPVSWTITGSAMIIAYLIYTRKIFRQK